jgi:UDP-N-acetylmuramyl tripeptide synthase
MPAPGAMTIARTAGRLSRALGRGGGTSVPGAVLLRLDEAAPDRLARRLPGGVMMVSATNGKTTTSRMLGACLQADDRRVVANRAGANLLSGVTTALLEASRDDPAPDIGLFEVDEAALPEVVTRLAPEVLVLMNLFRDQLDRYGELERLTTIWAAMIDRLGPDTTIVVNADDHAVFTLAGLGCPGRGARANGPRVMTFGVDDTSHALTEPPHAADATRCRCCGAELRYDPALLGHMGRWSCLSCGASRPTPDVSARRVVLDGVNGIELTVDTPAGAVEASIPVPGLHNAYNATAAVAGALAAGVPVERIGPALGTAVAAFGRGEQATLGGRRLVLLLAKNPAGANETVRTVLLEPGRLNLLIALNDRTADGHDVSWIWDVDYEPLLDRIDRLTVTGDRAHDMALRFRYAGLDPERMNVVPSLADGIDAAVAGAPEGASVYVLPTYTAMLGIREVLVERGAAEAFWRDGAKDSGANG